MTIPHVNVIIATPGFSLLGKYVHSLLQTLEILSEKGLKATFANHYSSHVADAREITLSGSLINNIYDSRPFGGTITYDKILWIDSDITWKPEDALKLIESDKDIITGAYLLGTGGSSVHPKMLKPAYSYEDILNKTELEKVEGCGFGFIAVKQGVFEKLPRPWFQSANTVYGEGDNAHSFNMVGEDLSWCVHVRNLGFDIWFDPTVRVNHHKTVQLTWEGIRP